ncbi:uncharacterized protein LOC127750214 [Frankliniella occidentalis]|uniref:Uncharacterized protein LOC127750214 n=1 Tax=Frankliniella occidentalis TaxID=133901 RepID=A0A9C6XQ42_FRAOC|nr:uncharacterized protein LOC127750214 [Frankliniella occidentalis]
MTKFGAGPGFGWRHIQLLIMFASASTAITMRVCLSVAIVVMTGPDEGDGFPVTSIGTAQRTRKCYEWVFSAVIFQSIKRQNDWSFGPNFHLSRDQISPLDVNIMASS